MPKLSQLLADMQGEDRHVALLVAQVGAMPTEIQLILQTAQYDESVKGLRPLNSYIVRVVGASEHRISSLGMTSPDLALVSEHPLLMQYTEKASALFFRGMPRNVHELVLDIAQTHAQVFQGWRHFPEYLNVDKPLSTLLSSGGGLLGQMPASLAQALAPVLQHHGLETNILYGESHTGQAQGPLKEQALKALIIGDSYFISYMFSIEEMSKR